jgi:hypothetical protein
MSKFVAFYNKGRGDSINEMFSDSLWKELKAKSLWNVNDNKKLLEMHGRILSVKYLGIDETDDSVRVFKTVFSKDGVKASSFKVDKTNHFETFRLMTSSDPAPC